MKLSKQIDTALKSYRKSLLFSAENKEYLEKDDGRIVSRVAKLEEALEFYADESRWEGNYFYGPSCLDKGPDIAIAALKEINDLPLW